MIGSDSRFSSSLHNVAVPAVAVAVEAAWLTAFARALIHAGTIGGFAPFYASVLLPGLLALVVAAISATHFQGTASRAAALVVIAVPGIGACVSVGALASFSLSGHAILVHPFAIGVGPNQGSAIAWSWFLTVALWARGSWLGWRRPSRERIEFSVSVSTVAFVTLIVLGNFHRLAAFHAEHTTVDLVLFLIVPAMIAMVMLVHEREISETTVRRRHSAVPPEWIVAVGLPVLLVGLVALVLALIAAPGGSSIASVVHGPASAIGRLFGREPAQSGTVAKENLQALSQLLNPAHSHRPHVVNPGLPLWVWLLVGFVALGALLLIVFAARAVVRHPWRYLRGLLSASRRAIVGAFRARRSRTDTDAPAPLIATPVELANDSIRWHYRSFLGRARVAGFGRDPAETPLEFETRIRTAHSDEAAHLLEVLTRHYHDARYGDAPTDPADTEDSKRLVDDLSDLLAAETPPAE